MPGIPSDPTIDKVQQTIALMHTHPQYLQKGEADPQSLSAGILVDMYEAGISSDQMIGSVAAVSCMNVFLYNPKTGCVGVTHLVPDERTGAFISPQSQESLDALLGAMRSSPSERLEVQLFGASSTSPRPEDSFLMNVVDHFNHQPNMEFVGTSMGPSSWHDAKGHPDKSSPPDVAVIPRTWPAVIKGKMVSREYDPNEQMRDLQQTLKPPEHFGLASHDGLVCSAKAPQQHSHQDPLGLEETALQSILKPKPLLRREPDPWATRVQQQSSHTRSISSLSFSSSDDDEMTVSSPATARVRAAPEEPLVLGRNAIKRAPTTARGKSQTKRIGSKGARSRSRGTRPGFMQSTKNSEGYADAVKAARSPSKGSSGRRPF